LTQTVESSSGGHVADTNYHQQISWPRQGSVPRLTAVPGIAETSSDRSPNDTFRLISSHIRLNARVSVIIPAMNEAANLPHVFASLPAWVDEVILVDGRSTDDTVRVAQRLYPDIIVVEQTGRGKGDALLAGFRASTGDIVVTMDADGSTDGREIVRFVAALAAGADFVKGSRFANGGGSADLTPIRRCGNRILSGLVNRLFGTRYTDLCYGFNAFWARHLAILALQCEGFEVETLMNIRAAEAGLSVHEVPSFEHRRLHGASNLRIVIDGWRIARVIVHEWRLHWEAQRPSYDRFLARGMASQHAQLKCDVISAQAVALSSSGASQE
jgi:glycosyltransferase involved in cell wall biosynthesis